MGKTMWCIFVIIGLFIISCLDQAGNVGLMSYYPYDVIVKAVYTYYGETRERSTTLTPARGYDLGVYGHGNSLISICIEKEDGTLLAEYDLLYILKIRNAYKKKPHEYEGWIFSEKGLFPGGLIFKFGHAKVSDYFRDGGHEKIMDYYRSDEAVKDLETMLERGEIN